MVLTSSGEVLTNNHVIAGATSISVLVPGTSHRYTARVVGYDVRDDVAVLRLVNATNLEVVTAASATPKVGVAVTAIGNAGGTGRLLSAQGTITGVGKTITASDENGASEQLNGLLETNANIQPGDSGGPLVNAAGRVVGMVTAGSSSSNPYAGYSVTDAYAIPIAKAERVAAQIAAGKSSARVHIGGTAFLGIQVQSGYGYGADGAVVAGVVANGPAASAGLAAGDVITAIAGHQVGSPSDVQTIVLAKKPGQKVSVTYVDTAGSMQRTTVTLGSGPAQ